VPRNWRPDQTQGGTRPEEASIKDSAGPAGREEVLTRADALFEKMQAQAGNRKTEMEKKAEELKKGMIKAGRIQPGGKEKA